MKFRLFFTLIVVLPICGASYFACTVHRYANTTVPNAYAVWWVGSMVVDYMRQNDDRWPQSWDDLRPIYDQHVAEVGQPWTFDQLKSRVIIRWDVDVEHVRQLSAPPDDLVVLRDGGKEHWAGQEPNEMVHQYLTQSQPASHRPQLTGDARE